MPDNFTTQTHVNPLALQQLFEYLTRFFPVKLIILPSEVKALKKWDLKVQTIREKRSKGEEEPGKNEVDLSKDMEWYNLKDGALIQGKGVNKKN